MRLTVEDLDHLYGTEALEVFRHSRRAHYSDIPRLASWLRERTCPDCGNRVSNAPYFAVTRKLNASGVPHIELRRVHPMGYYLYFRPRGSSHVLPDEVRFVHQFCLNRRYNEMLTRIAMGPQWISHLTGGRA